MESKLTPEQQEYLSARGFRVIEGPQDPNSLEYPHISLRPRTARYFPGLSFVMKEALHVAGWDVAFPGVIPDQTLVEIIAGMVANEMGNDGEGANKLFQTTPGQPISVYMIDNTWRDVAKGLAELYPAKSP